MKAKPYSRKKKILKTPIDARAALENLAVLDKDFHELLNGDALRYIVEALSRCNEGHISQAGARRLWRMIVKLCREAAEEKVIARAIVALAESLHPTDSRARGDGEEEDRHMHERFGLLQEAFKMCDGKPYLEEIFTQWDFTELSKLTMQLVGHEQSWPLWERTINDATFGYCGSKVEGAALLHEEVLPAWFEKYRINIDDSTQLGYRFDGQHVALGAFNKLTRDTLIQLLELVPKTISLDGFELYRETVTRAKIA